MKKIVVKSPPVTSGEIAKKFKISKGSLKQIKKIVDELVEDFKNINLRKGK
jgi:hypothetical protein